MSSQYASQSRSCQANRNHRGYFKRRKCDTGNHSDRCRDVGSVESRTTPRWEGPGRALRAAWHLAPCDCGGHSWPELVMQKLCCGWRRCQQCRDMLPCSSPTPTRLAWGPWGKRAGRGKPLWGRAEQGASREWFKECGCPIKCRCLL